MLETVPQAKRSESNGRRKEEHLDISLHEDVRSNVETGLDEYHFVHQALPEINLADVDLSTTFLGKRLAAPLLVSSMVGGIERARRINRNLAEAAQAAGIAMGVGSLRCAIEKPETARTYQVRDIAPDILLMANLGAVQLNNGFDVDECRRAVEMIEADALILHLNPLQEALQPEGNTQFAGLGKRIERLCREMTAPVVVKEVGFGISGEAARILVEAGVSAIDVAGAGGSSWSEVEGRRAGSAKRRNIAAAFASWGIPTAESIRLVRAAAPGVPLIGSGGIRTGVDVAKAIALGADLTGMATPLLKAAAISAEKALDLLEEVIEGLRISMFCVGATNLPELRDTPHLLRKTGARA